MRPGRLIQRIHQQAPLPIRVAVVLAVGILSGFLLSQAVGLYDPVKAKVLGSAPHCSWGKTITSYRDATRLVELYQAVFKTIQVLQYDPALDIQQLVGSLERRFWIKRHVGKELLAYLLAEHDYMAENHPTNMVRRGDYVLDCGAHVGVFSRQALELGARTVIAIEPEPVNQECLRRNLQDEIAAGRLIVVPKGVWSSNGVLPMTLGADNSGGNSLVLQGGGGTIQVPVTTVDDIVRELSIPRVDYIKVDIEGAEREALQGAMATLRRFRPRLLVESYHRPDDMLVLPRLIRQAHGDYAAVCGSCEFHDGLLVPHVVFYE